MNDTTNAQTSETAAGATPPGEADGFAVIEKLNAENAELKDRVLRVLAEMENLRRRTEREVADARAYGVTAFESVPAEAGASADSSLKSLIEGVELTARDLQSALGRHGVAKLEPLGEKFDPNFHQAMYEAPDESVPAGAVAQVMQSGWKIGERVLRPALVGVSKGGAKAAPKGE
jgi:molecular chaperone GrpE